MLEKERILHYLKSDVKVFVKDSTESTNSDARELAKSGFSGTALIAAKRQSGGRGRLGRSFFSPDGGLYMSLLIKGPFDPSSVQRITTAAAIASARVFDRLSGKKSEIKWVNDIYIEGKKVCGILTEGQVTSDGRLEYAVVGIGANITAPIGGFPADIADRAGAIFDKVDDDTVNILAAGITDELLPMLERRSDAEDMIDEYRLRSCVIGREVDVMHIHGGDAVRATAVAIDGEFRLVVRYGDGSCEALSSGEVSIRM